VSACSSPACLRDFPGPTLLRSRPVKLPLAYLDASSASMLLSALAGGVAGIVVAIRLFFRRTIDRLLRRKPELLDEELTPTSQE